MSELQQQAEAIANRYPNRNADLSKLSDDEKALIYQLAKQDKTQTEIAHIIGCDKATVSRWLAKLNPTLEVAKQRAQHRALEVLDAALDGAVKAARDGQPEHALEVSDRLGTLEKRERDSSGARGGVQVVVLMPGQVQYQPPVIDVTNTLSPVPRNELPE
jgi:transcriptional regulator with XRE-family HTH domain